MPDDADELILKMQHLEAQARAQQDARSKPSGAGRVKTAADLLAQSKSEAQEARTRAVKARARLNFALDRMEDAERREWEALQAEARAETHAQLADDPLFKKP